MWFFARKVDVVYDTVGGPTNWQDALPIMKSGATFLAIAGDGGFVQMSPSLLYNSGMRMLTRSKPFQDTWFRTYSAFPNGGELAEMAAMMKAGTLRAVIDSTYELSEVKDAFARMKSGRAKGKIVVKIP
jgi:NADPH:quinone reductase-like Zn-dependent oxidoreductase